VENLLKSLQSWRSWEYSWSDWWIWS